MPPTCITPVGNPDSGHRSQRQARTRRQQLGPNVAVGVPRSLLTSRPHGKRLPVPELSSVLSRVPPSFRASGETMRGQAWRGPARHELWRQTGKEETQIPGPRRAPLPPGRGHSPPGYRLCSGLTLGSALRDHSGWGSGDPVRGWGLDSGQSRARPALSRVVQPQLSDS